MTVLNDGWNQAVLLKIEFQHIQPPCLKIKKPADGLCQRAALPISLLVLSVRPLTRHPEAEVMMVVVMCQRA
jgi:hypothetical protein